PAAIEVDGIEVARAPLARTLHVARGNHVVAAVTSGYRPLRRPIDIAGGETQMLSFDLVPTEPPGAPPLAPSPAASAIASAAAPATPPSVARGAGWGLVGVGGAVALTGTVLALARLSGWREAHHDLDG